MPIPLWPDVKTYKNLLFWKGYFAKLNLLADAVFAKGVYYLYFVLAVDTNWLSPPPPPRPSPPCGFYTAASAATQNRSASVSR